MNVAYIHLPQGVNYRVLKRLLFIIIIIKEKGVIQSADECLRKSNRVMFAKVSWLDARKPTYGHVHVCFIHKHVVIFRKLW